MAGIAPAARAAAQVWPALERPYAVLLLPAVLNGAPQKQELFLPLTLAYLLSAHVAFQFPLCQSALAMVERVFDDILRGLPKDSKGICYRETGEAESVYAFVPQSSLLLTDERGLQEMSHCNGLPLAVISKSAGNTHLLRMRNLEKIDDQGLRGKLVGCAQLINVQSEGFITEGHFSLSW